MNVKKFSKTKLVSLSVRLSCFVMTFALAIGYCFSFMHPISVHAAVVEGDWLFVNTDAPADSNKGGTLDVIPNGFVIATENMGKIATGQDTISFNYKAVPNANNATNFRISGTLKITAANNGSNLNQQYAGFMVKDSLDGTAQTVGPAMAFAGIYATSGYDASQIISARLHDDTSVKKGKQNFNLPMNNEYYVELIRIGNDFISIVNGNIEKMTHEINFGAELYIGMMACRGITAEFTNVVLEVLDDTATVGNVNIDFSQMKLVDGVPNFAVESTPDWSLAVVTADGAALPAGKYGFADVDTSVATAENLTGKLYYNGTATEFAYSVGSPDQVPTPAPEVTPTPQPTAAPEATPSPAPTEAPVSASPAPSTAPASNDADDSDDFNIWLAIIPIAVVVVIAVIAALVVVNKKKK